MRNQGGSREFRGFTVMPWLSDVCYLEGWGEGGMVRLASKSLSYLES